MRRLRLATMSDIVARKCMRSRLFAVVRLAAQDAEASVELLEYQQTYEPMRDRELAKCNQLATTFPHFVGMTVRTADREHDRCAAAVLHLRTEDVVRESDARHRSAALVEGVEMRVRWKLREQRRFVARFDDRERAVRLQTFLVLVFGFDEVRLLQPADDGEREFQRVASAYSESSYVSSGMRASSGTSIGTRGASFHRPSRS